MKPAKKVKPFSTLPNALEPVKPDYSDLSALFGEVGEKELRLLQELKSRASEVEAWIAADPARALELQQSPKTAVADLVKHLRLDARELRARTTKLPPGWKVDVLQVRQDPVGTKLLNAVWAHLNATQKNLNDFKADPFAVVNTVAGATGATAAERQAVVDALSKVLGIATLQPGSAVEWIRNVALRASGQHQTAGVFLHRD
jgi:hypothetical protein